MNIKMCYDSHYSDNEKLIIFEMSEGEYSFLTRVEGKLTRTL